MKRVYILVGADVPDNPDAAENFRRHLEEAVQDERTERINAEIVTRDNLLPVYDTLKKATRP